MSTLLSIFRELTARTIADDEDRIFTFIHNYDKIARLDGEIFITGPNTQYKIVFVSDPSDPELCKKLKNAMLRNFSMERIPFSTLSEKVSVVTLHDYGKRYLITFV